MRGLGRPRSLGRYLSPGPGRMTGRCRPQHRPTRHPPRRAAPDPEARDRVNPTTCETRPMNRSLILPILLVVLVAACGSDGDAEPQQSGGAAAPPSTVATANRSGLEAEMAEVADYRLTMNAVERWHQAQRNVYRQAEGNPELIQHLRVDLDDATLDDLEDHFASIPEASDAIEDAGLEVREFVLIVFSLYQAIAAQELIAGGISQDSVLAQMNVHPDDLRFARENRARLQQLQRETDALAPPELADGDDDY
jgi:hypothetical protein